jgi:7-methyl-GTP pyrophosphatase
MQKQNLVLASSSPARKTLLEKLQLNFICASPNIDESAQENENPEHLAIRLGRKKAEKLSKKYPNHLIIGADQVVILDGRQLTKPGNHEDTIKQLQMCSGRQVSFYNSVCVVNSKEKSYLTDLDKCTVQFRVLTTKQIENYVERERPYYCAGGFMSEGLGIALLLSITGEDPNSLIGLPLVKLISLLQRFDCNILEP